ncbi:ribonuclease H-like [Mauremys mutica]|uniref:ribonuclease H-like n=1 Tax=Mauremys mutica TaxID=74926 RepID=UPI001D168D36|nr:ribonuclease H-like [Mauremys mutica]
MYINGKAATGFVDLHVAFDKAFKGTIAHNSAQAAEIVAIIVALENAESSTDITICTDSDWTMRALLDWMVIWKMREMRTADNQSVAYVRYLQYAWQLAESRRGDTLLFKVKAHRKNHSEITLLNSKVDRLSKQAASLGPEFRWDKVKATIDVLTSADPLIIRTS